MSRQPRVEAAGGIHHVWQRGNNRRPIFLSDGDRFFFLRLLREAAAKYRWNILAYCLMQNHFHLVVETPFRGLGFGMRDLEGRYAQWFNERHGTGGGHLFQARFGSKLVRGDQQLAQLIRYVARNPVRAGLCESPERWRWSSHRTLIARRPHPLVAVERVEALLEPSAAAGGYASLFDERGPLRNVDPDLSPWKLRPALGGIFENADEADAIRTARQQGYRLREIAAHLGVAESTVSRRARQAA